MCGPDEVCYDNGTVLGCPPYSHAPPGSDSVLDCLCDPGYYGPGVCAPCPADAFCTGGDAIAVGCMEHAVAPERSTGEEACFCDRGYFEPVVFDDNSNGTASNATFNNGTTSNATFSNGTTSNATFNNKIPTIRQCLPCPPGAWCWTGVLNPCPAHTLSPPFSSRPANCTCQPGYTTVACVPCPPGAFKPDNGTAPCMSPCPADAYCPLATATPLPCPPDAPNTHPGAFDPAQCQNNSDFYLAMCPASKVCPTPPPASAAAVRRRAQVMWWWAVAVWLTFLPH